MEAKGGAIMILGIFGFALAAAYVPWITGAAATPRWAVLVVGAVTGIFMGGRPARISEAHILGTLFIVWALISMSWAPAPEAFDAAWKLILLALLFSLGYALADLRPLFIGAALGIGISSWMVIMDRLGLIEYAQVSRPSGLFVNGLYLAEFSAMVIVGLLAHGLWRWSLLCWPSLLLVTLARGPLVAMLVAGLVVVWSRSRAMAAFAAAGFVAGALPVLTAWRPATVVERWVTWTDAMGDLTLRGHGLGSYFSRAPLISSQPDPSAMRNLHVNNDLLEVAYELGVPGLALALAFLATLLWARSQAVRHRALIPTLAGSNPAAPAKLVVIVFVVEGLVGFPFHLPWTAGLFAIVAGHVARDELSPAHGAREERAGGG